MSWLALEDIGSCSTWLDVNVGNVAIGRRGSSLPGGPEDASSQQANSGLAINLCPACPNTGLKNIPKPKWYAQTWYWRPL